MRIHFSDRKAVLAVVGHAGCGHCNSHNQFVQEDSVGLATVVSLLQEAADISLMIRDVRVNTGIDGYVEVETESGGISRATARRGIAFHEARLAKSVVGQQAIRSQTLVMEAFGRLYGQGVHETPVALQTAIANAALDSFVRNFPERFVAGEEDLAGSCGKIIGTVLEIEGIPTAVLATVNASAGGLGPNEDLEGNSAVGAKYAIMRQLGMLTLPTIVVEGKVYWPKMSDHMKKLSFLVRADPEADNLFVAESVYRAAIKAGYAVVLDQSALPRVKGALKKQTADLGEKIIVLGQALKAAEYANDKVDVLAALAKLVSEDGAGVTFMSNGLHELVGGIGMNPGSSAVLSCVVPKSYHSEYIVPFATEADLRGFIKIVKGAVSELYDVLPEATRRAEALDCTERLESLIWKG